MTVLLSCFMKRGGCPVGCSLGTVNGCITLTLMLCVISICLPVRGVFLLLNIHALLLLLFITCVIGASFPLRRVPIVGQCVGG